MNRKEPIYRTIMHFNLRFGTAGSTKRCKQHSYKALRLFGKRDIEHRRMLKLNQKLEKETKGCRISYIKTRGQETYLRNIRCFQRQWDLACACVQRFLPYLIDRTLCIRNTKCSRGTLHLSNNVLCCAF